jgi:hypothetical protein
LGTLADLVLIYGLNHTVLQQLGPFFLTLIDLLFPRKLAQLPLPASVFSQWGEGFEHYNPPVLQDIVEKFVREFEPQLEMY